MASCERGTSARVRALRSDFNRSMACTELWHHRSRDDWHISIRVLFSIYKPEAVCDAGSCVREWAGHTAGIQALATDETGAMIITGSDDHTARIFGL